METSKYTSNKTQLKWWKKKQNAEYLIGFLFVFPALLNFAVFRYYPMLWSANTSLWDYSLLGGFEKFVGLGNYKHMFQDKYFWGSLLVTLKFFLMYVPSVVGLATLLAVFVSQNRKGMNVARAIIYIPVVTSFVVVSIIWGMLLNRQIGLVNSIIQALGFDPVIFLMDKQKALPTIAMISIWKNVGYSMIIIVAALKGISKSFYEAAIVDGANAWQRFWKITIPMIRRQLMFVTVWATLGAFQVFIPIYSLTQGGPRRSTRVIVYYLYERAFSFGEMGYASAISMILLIILLIVSVFQMKAFKQDY